MGKCVWMVRLGRIPQIQKRLHRLCRRRSYATSEVDCCCELANCAYACVCCTSECSSRFAHSFMCWPQFTTCQMRRIVTEPYYTYSNTRFDCVICVEVIHLSFVAQCTVHVSNLTQYLFAHCRDKCIRSDGKLTIRCFSLICLLYFLIKTIGAGDSDICALAGNTRKKCLKIVRKWAARTAMQLTEVLVWNE